MLNKAFAAITLLSVMGIQPADAQDSEFFPFSHPSGTRRGLGEDVSDGGRVVGSVGCESGGIVAFSWTPPSEIKLLESIENGCAFSSAKGVSDDGQIVTGHVENPEGTDEAFIWTDQGGLVTLPASGGDGESYRAEGISGDSRIIVGAAQVNGNWNGVLWKEDGSVVNVGFLDAAEAFSTLRGASENGDVVVGGSINANGNFEAIRWTEANGLEGLGFLPGGTRSRALSASADGNTIVGYARVNGSDDYEAFVWKRSTGMLSIGHLPDSDQEFSAATSVSANGTIVVGSSDGQAFIWTPQAGIRRADQILIESGAIGLEGWQLIEALAISANGQWLTGSGLNPEGERTPWAARLDASILSQLTINAGLNDAWYNPATAGQGFFINVFPAQGQVFLAWFTYDTERPPEDVTAHVGEPSHRWLVALGPYQGDTVVLDVFNASGGIFNDPTPVTETPPESYGTITVQFHDCMTATLDYDLFSLGLTGSIPIQRIAADNESLCQQLNVP